MIARRNKERSMRFFWVTLASAFVLAGCNSPTSIASQPAHGRYVCIGVYSAGTLWSKMVIAAQPKASSAATIADDEHVIVVVDSQSGEVRECGDYTGVCVSLNPWTKAITSPQSTPVTLTKHLADVVTQAKQGSQPEIAK
jgi:hypothetical protein